MHYTQCILLFILKPIAPKKWIDAIQKISNKHSLKPAVITGCATRGD